MIGRRCHPGGQRQKMAKKYQRRPSEVAVAAWARGHMTALELFRVAAIEAINPWRGQTVSSLTSNAMWEDWCETARHAIGASASHSGLLGLEGVGYPMATAILDILDSGVWPVMGRWAAMTVFGPRPDRSLQPGTQWQLAAAYEAYARHLVKDGAAAWGSGGAPARPEGHGTGQER